MESNQLDGDSILIKWQIQEKETGIKNYNGKRKADLCLDKSNKKQNY
jgi:hypothetical protein